MFISGHETRSMLERYDIVSLKNLRDAGAKLWTLGATIRRTPPKCRVPSPKQIQSRYLHGKLKSTAPTHRKRRRKLARSGAEGRRFASLFALGRNANEETVNRP